MDIRNEGLSTGALSANQLARVIALEIERKPAPTNRCAAMSPKMNNRRQIEID